MAQFQTSVTGDIANPWDDVCCEACWFAHGEKCECRCGGAYHGAGNPNNDGIKLKKRRRIQKHIQWQQKQYRIYPSAQKYKKLITDPNCHCGFNLTNESVFAYAHSDGWKIEESNSFQWLWITCPKCGYDMSLWKLGVPRSASIVLEVSA